MYIKYSMTREEARQMALNHVEWCIKEHGEDAIFTRAPKPGKKFLDI